MPLFKVLKFFNLGLQTFKACLSEQVEIVLQDIHFSEREFNKYQTDDCKLMIETGNLENEICAKVLSHFLI